jgi:hypothetical protein
MSDLANRALLVNLTISAWSARKLDKRESAEVEARNGTVAGAARVNKALLPMAKSLDAIQRVAGAAKNYYYENTLPWTEGMRIIRTEGYIKFARDMGDFKVRHADAVRDFELEYPQLLKDAEFLLGTLHRPDDYPHPSEVANKFSMDVAFYPVPNANDWRVDLADSQMERLREQVSASLVASQGKAMREAWQRLYDVCQKAHERLAAPDAVFRDTLIENIRDMCGVLPTFNIADDPELERMRQQVEGSICQYEPQELRDSTAKRQRASAQLAEIMAKMGGMYAAAA